MKFSGSEKAYAKINLHLEILNKREDGYHDILSVMSNVDLYDEIEITAEIDNYIEENVVKIENIPGNFSDIIDEIPVKDNLMTKAIVVYMDRIDKKGIFTISIKKNIPSGAGLGGGSSDAATVLRFLNNSLSMLQEEEMILLCSEIGADVPFCYVGGMAICEGIGEKIHKLDNKIDSWIVLVNDGIHVNTRDAYNGLKIEINQGINEKVLDEKKEGIINGINKKDIDVFNGLFVNDFEKTVFEKYSEVSLLKSKLNEFDFAFSLMSGSGSTVYGLFAKEEDAKKTFSFLKSSYESVILTKFV